MEDGRGIKEAKDSGKYVRMGYYVMPRNENNIFHEGVHKIHNSSRPWVICW